jgi:hypothetical protein
MGRRNPAPCGICPVYWALGLWTTGTSGMGLNANGVTGLVRRSARAVDSTVLAGPTSGTTVARAVMLAGTCFGEVEVDAEGLPLAVDEVVKLATDAECGQSVTERLLAALPHVRVGLTEADGTEGLRLFGGTGAKGVPVGGPGPFVRVRV